MTIRSFRPIPPPPSPNIILPTFHRKISLSSYDSPSPFTSPAQIAPLHTKFSLSSQHSSSSRLYSTLYRGIFHYSRIQTVSRSIPRNRPLFPHKLYPILNQYTSITLSFHSGCIPLNAHTSYPNCIRHSPYHRTFTLPIQTVSHTKATLSTQTTVYPILCHRITHSSHPNVTPFYTTEKPTFPSQTKLERHRTVHLSPWKNSPLFPAKPN